MQRTKLNDFSRECAVARWRSHTPGIKSMLTTAVLALLMPLVSVAQAPPRVARGVIVSLDHDTLTLKSQDGSSVRIALAPDWSVTLLKPIPVETIQPGSFVGTAEIPQLNGTGRSLEVHVFPPGVKVGEGH